MTRAELVAALQQHRVAVTGVRGDRVHVVADFGQRTSVAWVDETWMRCERGRAAIAAWRASQGSEARR